MRPFSMPMPSFRSTWHKGAKQFVVQDALETTCMLALSYSVWLTPMTKVFRSPLPGAEMMTFEAPASMWPFALSASTNRPVDSMTYSTPIAPHGNLANPSRLAAMHLILFPLTTSVSAPSVVTSCLNLPCVESYFIPWQLGQSL